MSDARERLVAEVAVLQTAASGGFRASMEAANAAWEKGEAFVHALEAEPDKPVQCPCCTKQVVLCTKHYRLHEPGTKCPGCREDM